MPRPYSWPASRLRDADTMRDLHILSKAKRIPITHLVSDAVRHHVAALRDEMDQPERQRGSLPIGFHVVNETSHSAA